MGASCDVEGEIAIFGIGEIWLMALATSVTLDVRSSDIDPTDAQLIVEDLREEISLRTGAPVRIIPKGSSTSSGTVDLVILGGATQTLVMLRKQDGSVARTTIPSDLTLRRERLASLVAQIFPPALSRPTDGSAVLAHAPPPPIEPVNSTLPWLLVGLGTAATVTSVVFAIVGLQKDDDLRELDRLDDRFDKISGERTFLVTTSVALLVGGTVSLGAGVLTAL